MAAGGPPHLGATFVPGGFDDYYMPAPAPELVSPSPQRITPEVPENIQNNLAHLELADNSSARAAHPPAAANPNPAPYQAQQQPQQPQQQHQQHQQPLQSPPMQQQAFQSQTPPQNPQPAPTQSRNSSYQSYHYTSNEPPKLDLPKFDTSEMPNFSPFPAITPKPNVPPSDEEKEQILENARVPVLNSNDTEMQLAWAQDVLAYIATSQLYEERISHTQPKRPATPEIEHQLRLDAMNIVNFLAEQHHPKAEFMKGMWLEFGNFGVRQDKREAFRCYARAADAGYHRAQYRMGMQFEQNNDPVKALIHYQRGAEAGDSASNYRLGMMTIMGQMGQQQDFARGIQMLRIAAENADENAPQGAYILGMLMVRELPQVNVPEVLLPYDEEGARLNIEKAAYLGFAKAQLKMGAAYELCSMGCEFDPALSLHYNSLAARQGEPEAEMAISKWFLCGYEGVFQKNDELAYVYAERAAQSGLATAEFAMGYFNEIGMHVKVNLEKAKEWYEKAAEQGNQDAAGRVEGLKKDGALSKEHEKAAINRIRSQYGSKRGGRPERLQNRPPVPPLPSVSDHDENVPPRAASAAPYPLADEPPRSASAAPYPLGDGPGRAAGPPGGFFNPNAPGGPPGGRGGSPGLGAFHFNTNDGPPPRPATTQNDPRSRSPQSQQRYPSGPPGFPGGPQGFHNGPGPGPRANSLSPRPGPQPMQDIGFVAPLAPRRQTPTQSPGQSPVYGAQGQAPGPRQPRGPGAGQPGVGGRNPRPGGGMEQQQQQGRPGPQGPGRPGAQAGRPGAGPGPQRPGPKKPAAAPMGNGPKTFEEMGIAAQKQEGECIVM